MPSTEKTPIVSSVINLVLLVIVQSMVLYWQLENANRFAIAGYIITALTIPIINKIVFNILAKDYRQERKVEHEKMKALDSSSIIIVFDMQGKIVEANENFCITTGYRADQLIGEHHKKFFLEKYSTKATRNKFWNKLRDLNSVTGEFELITSGDNTVWVSTTYTPIDINGDGSDFKVISISQNITKEREAIAEIIRKNNYLEHAAKIIRHDMHSGINTYIPKGARRIAEALEKDNLAKELRLEVPLKLLMGGIEHTQRVYHGVREFTDLVKQNSYIHKETKDLKALIEGFLKVTAYAEHVKIEWLPMVAVNESLFCTAISNLIINGIKYNDSSKKIIIIKMIDTDRLAVIDNGRGMSKDQFIRNSEPYFRDNSQKEPGTGLGLSISIAILKEHGFECDCIELETGTMITIKVR